MICEMRCQRSLDSTNKTGIWSDGERNYKTNIDTTMYQGGSNKISDRLKVEMFGCNWISAVIEIIDTLSSVIRQN